MGCKLHQPIPRVTGIIAGVDEAGRGPLVGSVVASAVILGEDTTISKLADSKKLTAKVREELAQEIREVAIAWAVVSVTAEEIDRLNIFHATMLAMQRSVEQLAYMPDHVFVDGTHCPQLSMPATSIVKGDARVAEISAASILAKVERDRQMFQLHSEYPDYGFDQHKGYPTKAHIEALNRHGPCPLHRRSYRPVRELLEK